MKKENAYIVVYSTFPNMRTTQKILRGLIAHKLAACGNIIKLHSMYTWKDTIEQSPEYGVLIKTKKKNYKKVEAYIKKHHAYEVPEIVCWTVEKGLPDYLTWISEATD